MIKPLISIVIPVYNLEDYVLQALDSIYTQDVDESLFEVVAIDDGSKDSSYATITEYAADHTNMIVSTQKNGGVSKARNKAMGLCAGEYITFLDADDRFAPDSLSLIIEALEKTSNVDVIYCRSFAMYPEGEKEAHIWQNTFKKGTVYTGLDLVKANYINGGSVWGGIYRRGFLINEQLFFAEGVANSEDSIFNYILYSRSPSVTFIDVRLNLITIREGSASRNTTISRAFTFENNMTYLLSYRDDQKLSIIENKIIDLAFYQSISLAVNMYINAGGNNRKELYQKLHLKKILPLNFKYLPFEQKCKVCLLNVCYPLFYLLVKIKNRNGIN